MSEDPIPEGTRSEGAGSEGDASAPLRKRPFLIGVAGGTGSGKTTVSRTIQRTVGSHLIAFLQHDSYYRDHSHLTPSERELSNYDHPDSLDTPFLLRHLHDLRGWQAIEVPIYDFATHTRSSLTERVEPAPIILLEGILIFSERELRELMDMRIYVDTDADIRFIRRLYRDVEERGRTLDSIVNQYLNTVRPMHMEFVEPSKRYADVIIPEGGNNHVAMEMIVNTILAIVARS
jgi:uridine kinase